MTTGHIFFIPLMIAVGFVLGLLLGRRSHDVESEEDERLEARRQARRARLAAATSSEPTSADPAP